MGAKKTTTKNTQKSADSSILRQPRMTEKAANAAVMAVYVFDIAPNATKNEVAKAFSTLYKHTPLKVNLVTKKPKAIYRRTAKGGNLGFTAKTKKAYIYLPKGTSIVI